VFKSITLQEIDNGGVLIIPVNRIVALQNHHQKPNHSRIWVDGITGNRSDNYFVVEGEVPDILRLIHDAYPGE